MKTKTLRFGGLALFAITGPAFLTAANTPPYQLVATIEIGGEGGWDYLSVGAKSHRLYVSHATKVVVIDTANNQIVGEISDTPGIHGTIEVPSLGKVFTSNGREGTVSVVDAETLKTVTKLHAGENPDAILFEPTQNEIYTFNGRSKDSSQFSAADGTVKGTLPLGDKPEFSATDDKGAIFVNLENTAKVAAIDAATHRVKMVWSIAPGESPSGLAIDVAHHRLFSGCDNQQIVVSDYEAGKVVATIPAGEGIDAVAFDPETQLVFSSNGADGTCTIAHEDAPNKYTVIQTLNTARGARTMTLDPSTHRIYLATADFEPTPSGVRQRPKAKSGTFKVLVFGLK